MAYSQQFHGSFQYKNPQAMDVALELAFSKNRNIKKNFVIEASVITINQKTYAPATVYYEYSAALSVLAEHAISGEMKLCIFGDTDEVEIIKAQNVSNQSKKSKVKTRKYPDKATSKPVEGLKLKNTIPLDAFKVDAYYKQFRDEEHLKKSKYFHCSNCQRRTLFSPNKIMPVEWPLDKSKESCFEPALKKLFDKNTKEKEKTDFRFLL